MRNKNPCTVTVINNVIGWQVDTVMNMTGVVHDWVASVHVEGS